MKTSKPIIWVELLRLGGLHITCIGVCKYAFYESRKVYYKPISSV